MQLERPETLSRNGSDIVSFSTSDLGELRSVREALAELYTSVLAEVDLDACSVRLGSAIAVAAHALGDMPKCKTR